MLIGEYTNPYPIWIGNITEVEQTSQKFLGIIDDLDQLYATNSQYLLGVWIEG